MAINQEPFNIHVKSDADNAGFDKATSGIAEVSKAASGAASASQELTKATKETGDSSIDMGKKGNESHNELKTHAEHSTLSHHELRESIHAVTRAFGGLSEAGLLLSGPTAAVFALTKGIEALKEGFDKMMEVAVEAVAKMNEFNAAKIKAVSEAAHSAADAMERYKTAQEEAISGEAALDEAAKAASTRRLAEMDAQIEATKKLNEAEEKLTEARIQRLADTGQITQEEADKRKHREQEDLATANATLDAEREHASIAEKKIALKDATERLPHETQEQVDAVSKSKAIASEKEQLEKRAEEAEEAAKAQREKANKATANAQLYAAGQTPAGFINANVTSLLTPTETQANIFNTNQEAEKQERYAQLLESRSAHIQALIKGDEAEAEKQKDRAEALQKQIEADKKTIATAPEEIKSAERIAQTHQRSATDTQFIEYQTHRTEEQTEADKARQRLLEHQQSGQLSPQDHLVMQTEQNEFTRHHAATETGPQGGLDAAEAVAAGRDIYNTLRSQHGYYDRDQLAEVRQILNQITGFLENHSANMQSQQSDLRDTQRRLELLEDQYRYSSPGQP